MNKSLFSAVTSFIFICSTAWAGHDPLPRYDPCVEARTDKSLTQECQYKKAGEREHKAWIAKTIAEEIANTLNCGDKVAALATLRFPNESFTYQNDYVSSKKHICDTNCFQYASFLNYLEILSQQPNGEYEIEREKLARPEEAEPRLGGCR